MSRSKIRVSRDIGLALASLSSKYFLKSPHLHYGYWTDNLKVDIANISSAQENYAAFLVSHIPKGVKKILDVGCGTGEIARRLVDMCYLVDCVSPSPFLSQQARNLLPDTCHIYECFYEDLQTQNKYDLILFSESFQYINPQQAIKKTLALLNEEGFILICDIFKKDTPAKSPLHGGHHLKTFYNIIADCPLESVRDLDITEQTAPTLDIVNDILKEVVQPSIELTRRLLNSSHPYMSKFLGFLYRKKINKLNRKYFTDKKTAENFKKFKSYRLMLYKKTNLSKA